MNTRASLTAEYMALFRALESSRRPDSRLFSDPFAAIFLHHWRKWFYWIARFDLGRLLVEHVLDQAAPGARAAGIARTKWIDDEAKAALETATQLVLLGAGFDTRAYRMAGAARAATFELDYAETSFAKQMALRKAIGSLPEHVRFVGIDFNSQSVAEALIQAGFDRERPACLIWEGVTNYLTTAAVDSTLRQIGQAAPNSILLFTYIDRGVLETPERFFGAAKLMARLQSYEEPWTFGLRPEEVQGYLAARGFRLLADVSVAEVWQDAGRSSAGTRGYEFYRLASARAVLTPMCS
jgi:methyltransferase (TIGR00027 family)